MSRPVPVSEPKWGDEVYFEEVAAGDCKTALWIGIGCLVLAPVLVLSVVWWLISTIASGRDRRETAQSREVFL